MIKVVNFIKENYIIFEKIKVLFFTKNIQTNNTFDIKFLYKVLKTPFYFN